MTFEGYAAEHSPLIESRLSELLPPSDAEPCNLHAAMRYSTLGGGKRFRPLLCIAACEAIGGTPTDALDAACAIEMVHCFSLIHDDLPALDNDDLRRGRPACHIVFGEAIALLAGDALFCLAFEELVATNATSDQRLSAIGMLAQASGTAGMVGGQTRDIELEGQSADLETVNWIHTRKTGSLIAAAAGIGAIFGGASEDEVTLCNRVGMELGRGFQIADDVLNRTGSESALGKRTGTDQELGKATYPAVLGLEGSTAELEAIAVGVEKSLRTLGVRATALSAVCEYGLRRQT